MRVGLLLAALASGCSSERPAQEAPSCSSAGATASEGPPFTDATGALGIDFERHHTTPYAMPDIMGGGVCMFDVDGDDDLDLYFTDRAPFPNRLYRNDGPRFTDVTELWGAGSTSDTMGCLAFDADGDADADLLLTNFGPSVLLRNEGRAFSDATAESGIATDNMSTSATAGDMDGDGDLDLAIARFVDPASCKRCPHDGVDDCQLDPHTCTPLRNLLFENRGGRFVEVGAERGLVEAEPTLAILFVDFDIDGDLDLYVGNDVGRLFPDRMFMNDGSGHFVDRAPEMGLARDTTEDGGDTMGVAIGDYDRNGILDLVSTNIDERPTLLFQCRSGPVCVDSRTSRVSLDASLGTIGWGVGFVDVNNDGWLDIFSVSGQDYAADAAQRSLLFWNRSGRFDLHVPGEGDALAIRGIDRGAAFGDLDGDGGVDVAIAPNVGRARILRNRGPRGHQLTVALDTLSAGATVTVRAGGQTLRAPAVIGGSFLGSSSPHVSFGLGRACSANVEVRWLGGRTATLQNVPADRTIFVSRPRP